MTKKEMYELIASTTDNEEIKDFCAHEIENLAHRAQYKSKKQTAERAVNQELKEKIVSILVNAEEPMKASAIGELLGVSTQKTSALVKQMVDAGTVQKTVGKKNVSYFSIA